MAAKCYWITGLSGAGKSTLSNRLKEKLPHAVILDGDALREMLQMDFGHDIGSRLKLSYIYSRMAKFLVESGVTVIVATISLFHEVQKWNRENIKNYNEIFLDIPIEELKKRDSKRIYSRAENGELKDVVGVDIKAEFPLKPDFIIREQRDIESFLGGIK